MARGEQIPFMLAERNRLAKLLNQRMVRLEKAGIDYGAIRRYKEFIAEYYGESKTGKLRFPEKRFAESAKSWNKAIALRREADILAYFAGEDFKTSTPARAKATEARMIAQFEALGLKFPNREVMLEFLNSESWKTVKKIYGSKLAVRLMGMKQLRRGSKDRRSSVEAMDARLQKFLKRMGSGYDVRTMDEEDIARVFGLDSEDILEAIEEGDDLPL